MKILAPPTGSVTLPDLRAAARAKTSGPVFRAEWGPITASQVAFYCAAIGVADPIHYNLEVARDNGFDRLVVNGSFRWSLMTLTAEEIFGSVGWIAESTCRHLAPMSVGATVVVELELTELDEENRRCVLAGRNVIDSSIVDRSEIVLRLEQ